MVRPRPSLGDLGRLAAPKRLWQDRGGLDEFTQRRHPQYEAIRDDARATRGAARDLELVLKNGAYNVSQNGKSIVKGNYTIKKSTISLTDTSGPGKCPGTGKYKFKISGKSVTLTKISDAKACIGRQDVLAHKFTKVA